MFRKVILLPIKKSMAKKNSPTGILDLVNIILVNFKNGNPIFTIFDRQN